MADTPGILKVEGELSEEQIELLRGYHDLTVKALRLKHIAEALHRHVGALELGLLGDDDRGFKLEAVATAARLVVKSYFDASHDDRDLRHRIKLLADAVLELDR